MKNKEGWNCFDFFSTFYRELKNIILKKINIVLKKKSHVKSIFYLNGRGVGQISKNWGGGQKYKLSSICPPPPESYNLSKRHDYLFLHLKGYP